MNQRLEGESQLSHERTAVKRTAKEPFLDPRSKRRGGAEDIEPPEPVKWVCLDRRFEQRIQRELSVAEAIDAFKRPNPVRYNNKKDKEEQYVGFIAEDVPDLVAMKDRKALSPMDIVAVLTKVIQEQQKTISSLSEKATSLELQMKTSGVSYKTPALNARASVSSY